ncbi:hypothetical protein EYF80_001840 [Liparis tanakae]|uniref:Uncharacterized protein n=1 Tax=Liparis tanakae TaxID=230148 RepID=A0A4Z2JCE2_9TELE|nr:hypothetical protein EYF80_001840 [Liparis tanakae]
MHSCTTLLGSPSGVKPGSHRAAPPVLLSQPIAEELMVFKEQSSILHFTDPCHGYSCSRSTAARLHSKATDT